MLAPCCAAVAQALARVARGPTGTRLSEQPIPRTSGACCGLRSLKKFGSSARTCAAHSLVVQTRVAVFWSAAAATASSARRVPQPTTSAMPQNAAPGA